MAGREVNRRAIENFIKAGAFDGLGGNRRQFMMVYAAILDNVMQEKKHSLEGQMSLFDLVSEEEKKTYEIRLPDVEEYQKEELLAMEKEVLGIYVSGHPLEEYEEKWRKNISHITSDFVRDEETGAVRARDGERVMVGGMVTAKTVKYTKNNKAMAFLTVEDLYGTVEVIVFPRDYEKYHHLMEEDAKIFVRGRVSLEDEKNGKVICERICSFDEARQELWIQFADMEEYRQKEADVFTILRESDGRDPVVIYLAKERAVKRLGANMGVLADRELISRLKAKVGEKNIKLWEKSIEKS